MSDAPKRKVNPMLVLRGGRPGAPLPPAPAAEEAASSTAIGGGTTGEDLVSPSRQVGDRKSSGLPTGLPGLKANPPRDLPTVPGSAPSADDGTTQKGQDTVGDKRGLPHRLPAVSAPLKQGGEASPAERRSELPVAPASKRVNPLFADSSSREKVAGRQPLSLPATPRSPKGQNTVGDLAANEAEGTVGEGASETVTEVEIPKKRVPGMGGGLPLTPPRPVSVSTQSQPAEEEGFRVDPGTGELVEDEPELSASEKAKALLEANFLEDDSFVDTQSVDNRAEENWGTHSGPMPGERKKPARAVNPLFADVDSGSGAEVRKSTPGGASGARKTAGVNPMLRPGLKRAPTPSSLKPEAFVEGGDWDDEPEAPSRGPLAEGVAATKAKPRKVRRIKITERDQALVKFLARYKYATNPQLARLADVAEGTISGRMARLEDAGLVTKETITGYQYVWLATKAGHAVADVSFPMLSKSTLSFVTMGHSLGMVNLGVEFERQGGGVDLLGERKGDSNATLPMNRWYGGIPFNEKGRVVGEQTVTEREIQQAQKRFRGGADTATMRELVHAAAQPVEDDWEAAELQEGGEGLFIVYGDGGKTGEHIPDLVLARPRGEDGRPRHIAVELELNAKNPADWRRILRAYRDYGDMFEKVVYFTHKPSIARGLQRVADSEAGLKDKLVIRKYKPMNSRTPFWG